jgi:hypothetical protein
LLCTQTDAAEKRVALIIGNGGYMYKPQLKNPVHDVEDVTAALKRANFDIISGADLNQAQMQEAVIRFARASKTADVALFYYSGHALQFNGVNYLMPVDAQLEDESDLKRFTRVDDVMNDLQQAKNLRILVLDACRDNPFAESLRRSLGPTRSTSVRQGLAKMEAPVGTIVSFSTQAGQTADDGNGRNSPYTFAFVRRIEEPNEIGDVFREISSDVYESSGRTQLPELSLSIIGKFYLNDNVSVTVASQPPSADPCSAAEAHWKTTEALGTIAAYEDHLARFPSCAFGTFAKVRIEALKEKTAVTSPLGESTAPKINAGRFDGEWEMTLMCPKSGTALAYTRWLPAAVKNSVFHAEALTPGEPNWLRIDGKIGVDGRATLFAKGLTGPSAYNLGNVRSGFPFGWTVDARFQDTTGNGKRNEGRPCDVSFAKR